MSHNYPEIDPLDWSTVQPHVDRLLVAELKPTAVRAWMQDWSDLFAVLNETEFQIYREITENTADEEADARFKQYVQVIHPEQAKAEQALKKKLLSVEGYEPTSETALIFKRFQAEADLFREENIPIQTELALLGKQYDEITGGLSFEWEGESKTIPEVELLLSDRDRNTREKAWRLAQDAYLAKREELNDLFLKMLPLRRQMAKNAGFSDYRAYQWQVMARFGYTPEDAFTFHDAIEHEVVPLATQIYQTTAEQLGLEQLRPWETDISGPSSITVDPYDTPLHPFSEVDDLIGTTAQIFNQVDPVLGGYFEAMRPDYLDLASRPQQVAGRLLRRFPCQRTALHLHECSWQRRQRDHALARGWTCLPLRRIRPQPVFDLEPECANGILRGGIHVHGTAEHALLDTGQRRFLQRHRLQASLHRGIAGQCSLPPLHGHRR